MHITDLPFYFAHIPKTGGTSFIALLDHYFDADKICPHQLWWDIDSVKEIKSKNYQLFRGHFGGAAQLLSAQELNYITILRDPISLAASTYHYSKRDKNTKLHTFIDSNDLSFADFIDHQRTKHLVQNRMVRSLTFGLDNQMDFDDMTLTPDSYRQFKKTINKSRVNSTAEERLSRLKQFILNCHWFGILEQYDQSIDLLCYVMGWPPVTKTQKLNVHNKPQVIPPQIKEKLKALNHYDCQLYRFARQQFEKNYAHMLANLSLTKESKTEDIKKAIDKRYQSIHGSKTILKLDYHYTPKEPIFGDQWHRREWNPELKKYFCWSGPGQVSFIDLWTQQKRYLITVKLINAISSSLIENLNLLINNQSPEWHYDSIGRAYELTIHCDKQMISSSGLLRIQFINSELKAHKSAFEGDDNRIVGFALESITLKST
ncbi:sulfotransferase family 2 domain-containing protein [Marinicella gelatinilytica]|uniref:sulfotransferase family 2 domain-containing protein n=1 Tax=Marinicella gelatinilytica TaxID=2996017 RepID=UPI0022608FDF|nr:sulfotransferase family 2 domain-containing protein [Marinicella gelatinilytica]MCX7544505.1 sulfotransferase family 2 domain-containing protein [Marinicella gelatinilytica]